MTSHSGWEVGDGREDRHVAGQRVGRYEVVGRLGSGGMSRVSLARSESGHLVVLKQQLHENEDAALIDEARVGIRLSHPAIVETLDLFEHDGRPVLVVDYVSGASLADLRATGPLPVGVCIRVGAEIAEALQCIHEATEEDGRPLNMLHRDVTPANIIVGHDGHARLIDLGIARSAVNQAARTQEGMLKGTLRYLAPELLDTGIYSCATDLWGLGMTLWESALGRLAVEGDDVEVYRQICDGRAMALRKGETVDPRLAHAIGQLLSVAPECRPKTALDAASVFHNYLGAFGELDGQAQASVVAAVGPPQELTGQTGLFETQMLVNRAAATFGGPNGDWEVVVAPSNMADNDLGPIQTEILDEHDVAVGPPLVQGQLVATPDDRAVPAPLSFGAEEAVEVAPATVPVYDNPFRSESTAPPEAPEPDDADAPYVNPFTGAPAAANPFASGSDNDFDPNRTEIVSVDEIASRRRALEARRRIERRRTGSNPVLPKDDE